MAIFIEDERHLFVDCNGCSPGSRLQIKGRLVRRAGPTESIRTDDITGDNKRPELEGANGRSLTLRRGDTLDLQVHLKRSGFWIDRLSPDTDCTSVKLRF